MAVPGFLQGGGVMGAMLRDLAAEATPLGAPADWPLVLRNLVAIVLSAPQPMYIAWGPQRVLLYNDPYIEILGNKHPALGRPLVEVWYEVADVVRDVLARADAGQVTHMSDQGFVLQRHGQREQAYFNFYATPIRDAQGQVSGVLGACTETTVRMAELEQREAELSRLRAVFEQSPAPVAVLTGPAHRFELANAAFGALIGRRVAAGDAAAVALPDLAGQGFLEQLDAVYASGEARRHQTLALHLRPDGAAAASTRLVDFAFEPLRDAAGQVMGVVAQGVDLTEAQAQEQAQALVLRESEEKFRTFAQAVPNHVWTAPSDGLIDWCNRQTETYSGMSLAALAGVGWLQLVHADDTAHAMSTWSESLASGQDYEVEFRIRRHDGQYRWHLVRALPIRDAAGTVVRWIGTNTDIEQQRADREALRRLNVDLEQRVVDRTRERERIWRNSPDLMAVVQINGGVAEVNPAWTSCWAGTPNSCWVANLPSLVHPDDLPSAWAALARASQGVLPTFECRVRHADGGWRHMPGPPPPKARWCLPSAATSPTPRPNSRRLLQTAEQLRQSQKMEAIGQLTGGIAHDFNNMLAGVHGAIQLMQRRLAAGRSDNFETLLERAAASTQRAAALTQRLLAFARRHPLEIRRVDVGQRILSLEDMMKRSLGPKVVLQLAMGDALWPARIDGGQLENALLNLVINARDAMPDGGQLTVAAENAVLDARYAATQAEVEAGDYIAVRVSDTGVGMPEQVLARVFEPFFTTKPTGQGTGLGLSMVYGFAKQAGGHIRIDSQPGAGTTVSLFLPRDKHPWRRGRRCAADRSTGQKRRGRDRAGGGRRSRCARSHRRGAGRPGLPPHRGGRRQGCAGGDRQRPPLRPAGQRHRPARHERAPAGRDCHRTAAGPEGAAGDGLCRAGGCTRRLPERRHAADHQALHDRRARPAHRRGAGRHSRGLRARPAETSDPSRQQSV